MNAKQTIAIIIPIAIFIIKKYISLYITIPVLIAGCIITFIYTQNLMKINT